MGSKGNGLNQKNLCAVLIPRIGLLRDYLDQHTPASLRRKLVPDDILQEVWVAAYRTLPAFQPAGPDAVERWLISITHAKLVDVVRYARRAKRGGDRRYTHDARSPVTSFSSLFARLKSPDRTPSQDTHLIETAHTMLMALTQLPARQRRAVELQFLHGRSRQDIAAELETTEKAVKELVHRGLQTLRDILGPMAKYFTDASSTERLPADEADHVPT